ncbi:uncharacterized protein LOC134316719 [Trichomycterus rosablanca]|uniref:uncharacterized protein LOC134316719 n=1 Tax=Trichomycterus rosablanca TaxID=2290929 RepID=UPI002F35C5BA
MTEEDAQPMPQVLLVGEKDSKRLLEVYVRRSLSLNDGSQCPPRRECRPSKWVTTALRDKRERKHSSDSSLHIKHLDADAEVDLGKDEVFSEPEPDRTIQLGKENKPKRWTRKRNTVKRNDGSSASHCSGEKPSAKPRKWILHFDKDKRDATPPRKESKPDSEASAVYCVRDSIQTDQLESSTEMKKPKESKKMKKLSVWKSFIGLFFRGNTDKHEEQDGDDEGTEEHYLPSPPSTPPPSCLPIVNSDAVILRQTRSSKRKRSPRRLSLKSRSEDMGRDKANGRPCTLDLSSDVQQSMVESIEEVEPTSLYYEKMTEELQKIVNEVKHSPTEENRTFTDSVQPTDINGVPMSQEDVIKKIIFLIKLEGDFIDVKLKENPTIASYFKTLSYGSFQQLADQYVKSEFSQQTTQPPVAAPELVKFAFTLDFTARVAGLSRHAPGHIVGFGNQYLKERFTYKSESKPHFIVCTEKQDI